jgi:hypothetical protein
MALYTARSWDTWYSGSSYNNTIKTRIIIMVYGLVHCALMGHLVLWQQLQTAIKLKTSEKVVETHKLMFHSLCFYYSPRWHFEIKQEKNLCVFSAN